MRVDENMIALDLCKWDSHEYISTWKVLADSLTKGLRPMAFVIYIEDIGFVRSINVLS